MWRVSLFAQRANCSIFQKDPSPWCEASCAGHVRCRSIPGRPRLQNPATQVVSFGTRETPDRSAFSDRSTIRRRGVFRLIRLRPRCPGLLTVRACSASYLDTGNHEVKTSRSADPTSLVSVAGMAAATSSGCCAPVLQAARSHAARTSSVVPSR
jgi:hypothetical protein